MIQLAIYGTILLVVLIAGLRFARTNERFVIFRLGRFLKVAGPGVVSTVLLVDKRVRVQLDVNVPDWQGLSAADLNERVRRLALEQKVRSS